LHDHANCKVTEESSTVKYVCNRIGTYSKTRAVYSQYRDSGWSKKFYAAHKSDIIVHKAAEKHFDSLKWTKLSSIQSLKQEYAALDVEKRKLHQGYRSKREGMTALLRAKNNVDRLIGEPQKSTKTHERDIR